MKKQEAFSHEGTLGRIEQKIDHLSAGLEKVQARVEAHTDQLSRFRADRWWAISIVGVAVTMVAAWVERH